MNWRAALFRPLQRFAYRRGWSQVRDICPECLDPIINDPPRTDGWCARCADQLARNFGQCTACFRMDYREQTTSGLMCRTCAAEWRTHEEERLRAANPIINITISEPPQGEDIREIMERNRDVIARSLGIPASALATTPLVPEADPEIEANCPYGRTHDWRPWMNADGERQGDICNDCALTRRVAVAVARPPIPCDHRWVTEENMMNRTITVTCRTCRETHEINRETLESRDQLVDIVRQLGGSFTGGTLPGGRVTARTPIPARPRSPNPPNQGGSGQSPTGRRRRDPAPQSVPVPKPKRLQPGAPRPRRPLILDDDPEGSA